MQKTNLFFDTEFTGLHQKTTLISLGIVSECGTKTFYAEFTDYDQSQIDDWLIDNVMNKLTMVRSEANHFWTNRNNDELLTCGDTSFVKEQLIQWLKQFESVVMWSDCLSYDWVLFNNIFGHAFKIPEKVYYIPFDICTLFEDRGIDPDISREKFAEMESELSGKHNALIDALVIRKCYLKLKPKFDINRSDLYEADKPNKKERTQSRLKKIAEMGMQLVGLGEFGVSGVMSGLYIEKVWSMTDEAFEDYLSWAKSVIDKRSN